MFTRINTLDSIHYGPMHVKSALLLESVVISNNHSATINNNRDVNAKNDTYTFNFIIRIRHSLSQWDGRLGFPSWIFTIR